LAEENTAVQEEKANTQAKLAESNSKPDSGFKLDNKILPFVGIAVVFLVIGFAAGAIVLPSVGLATATASGANTVSSDAVGAKTITYLNDNFFTSQGLAAQLSNVTEDYGMYSVNFDVMKGTEKQGSLAVLVSKDSKTMLANSQVFDLDTPVPQDTGSTGQQFSFAAPEKSDTPLLEAFIVSQCPYGLQMQRLLAPIATGLEKNIKVLYLGSVVNGKITSMHGDAEAQENLRQICIREEQPTKYWAYVSEYMKAGNVDSALAAAGIDKTALNTCMTDPLKGLKYAQADFDREIALQAGLAQKYGVTEISFASPSVVLNGDSTLQYSSSGNYYSLSEEFAYATAKAVTYNARSAENVKNLLCEGFNEKPGACSATLSNEQANTSFSPDYSGGSASGGSC